MNERRQSGEETDGLTTVEGTVRSVVFHNEANGYTVLHVEPPVNGFELARGREITVVGKVQAVWEGEDVTAKANVLVRANTVSLSFGKGFILMVR